MYHTLRIRYFKSLYDVALDLTRVNVVIGYPNSGKSNIIDALFMLSSELISPQKYLRISKLSDIFFEQDISGKIEILLDNYSLLVYLIAKQIETLY